MTNITPEAKNTNRHSVLLVEKEGRNLARKYHFSRRTHHHQTGL